MVLGPLLWEVKLNDCDFAGVGGGCGSIKSSNAPKSSSDMLTFCGMMLVVLIGAGPNPPNVRGFVGFAGGEERKSAKSSSSSACICIGAGAGAGC